LALAAVKAFVLIKGKLINALILNFPDFDKVFELECNACGVSIGSVLLQEQKHIVFLSEKLNETRQK